MLLKVSDPPLDMFFLIFPKVFGKQNNIWENHTYKKKPNKPSGKPTNTTFLKVSDPPLDIFVFVFVFLVFPKGF